MDTYLDGVPFHRCDTPSLVWCHEAESENVSHLGMIAMVAPNDWTGDPCHLAMCALKELEPQGVVENPAVCRHAFHHAVHGDAQPSCRARLGQIECDICILDLSQPFWIWVILCRSQFDP